MTATIQETVSRELSNRGLGSYASQASPVVDALVEREQAIAETLVDFASRQGLPHEQAVNALQEAGLSVRTPEPTTTSSDDGRVREVVDTVKSAINSLGEALDRIVNR